MASRISRLSSFDLSNLRLEKLQSPFHFGAVVILDGRLLLDESGQLRLDEIRSRLARRLARLPELRRRVYFPGPLRGRALWVDDDGFDIRNHVLEATVDSPGGELQLLDTAARLYGSLLDRSRPLWELWFLTGLSDDRVGALLKLHHSVADGMAAVAIMASLFDFEADAAEPPPVAWSPAANPGPWELLSDNLSMKLSAVRRVLSAVLHPVRQLRALAEARRRWVANAPPPQKSAGKLHQPARQAWPASQIHAARLCDGPGCRPLSGCEGQRPRPGPGGRRLARAPRGAW